MSFRLTYATMYDPPEAMHERFEAALARVSATLGARHGLFIDGSDVEAEHSADRRAPFDNALHLGHFALASEADADTAMRAAHSAYPAWRATPVVERARLMRRVGDLLEERVYDMAAALVLEVGKNRMEALGEAQETVDFFRHYADDFESHAGYHHTLPDDPIDGVVSHNASVMRPYGVWVVIAPFKFPLALDGGPDGLEAYRELAALLPRILASGGHALLEIGIEQAQAMKTLFPGLELRGIAPDLTGVARCVILRKP